MSNIFKETSKINYEDPKNSNPFPYRWYSPDEIIKVKPKGNVTLADLEKYVLNMGEVPTYTILFS
jgi:hypothetical protein